MKRGPKRTTSAILAVAFALMILAGCGGEETSPASAEEAYTSTCLDASYEGALPAANQLILGTLLLEGTEDAVTPEQAQALLPLWQALQGDALQGQAEVNAVLGQIERAMTPAQLSAIAAMQLSRDDLTAWTQEQGIAPPQGQGPGGTGEFPGGEGPGGSSPEARETMRAQFESMSEEERAERMAELRATAEAGGMTIPEGGGGFGPGARGRGEAGMGQFGLLLEPLIDLLTQRAGA